MRNVWSWIGVAALAGTLAQPVLGQGGAGAARQDVPPAGRAAGRPAGPPLVDIQKLRTVEDFLNGWEMNQADKFLQLKSDQFAPFVQHLRKLQTARSEYAPQRVRMIGQLRQLLSQPSTEDAVLEAQTKKIDDFDRQAAQDVQAALAAIDGVLTVRQRAQFRVFQEQLEKRKVEILLRVLKVAPPPAGSPKAPAIK
jgi:hypothetical protein